MLNRKVYLGAGVHAFYDGNGIALTTEFGCRVMNRIYLDKSTLENFDMFKIMIGNRINEDDKGIPDNNSIEPL